ncbi:MAG: hypothetical protein GC160_07915 [Acidobacteria bacterium]|nr:hypothetical protein [Acidobacteriota bacterium]
MNSNMIDHSEVEIAGRWIEADGKIRPDEACHRIEQLTEKHLTQIVNSPIGGDWEILYRDPSDGRYWEKTYPQGEMQGGGPPCLRAIDIAEARSKYDVAGS